MSLNPHTRLNNHYTILKPLGEGGSSQTFLAEDDEGKLFALKTLHFGRLEDWKALEMFERQFGILKHLEHSGIPQVFEVFEAVTDGITRRFLVQEYVEGTTLKSRLTQGAHFDESEAQDLFETLLDVVEYLHSFSPPILHRDIKPSNIILRASDGKPVLIDFDAARGEGVDHQVADGTMVGTAGYVPMEQLAGRPVPASDIYSLGMTLVAMLTRKDPIDLPVDKMRVQFETFANVSDALKRTLGAMIEPDVDARLQSVRAVRAELRAPSSHDRSATTPARAREERFSMKEKNLAYPGVPKHFNAREVELKSWYTERRLVWGVEATASSSYGLGWAPKSACGPPKIFPWYGDRAGAWTSKNADGGKEWLSVEFPEATPPAHAVWIFETFHPGAIVRVETTERNGTRSTVWEGSAYPFTEAMVFQVDWAEPRTIQSVRLTLDTTVSTGWNEIDAVALFCSAPAHDEAVDWRTKAEASTWLKLIPLFAVVAVIVGIVAVLFMDAVGNKDAPLVTESISDTRFRAITPRALSSLDVVWASKLVDVSSEYSSPSWSGSSALGAPDVWPSHGDRKEAWAPSPKNAAFEWIEVGFPSTVKTRKIVVLETYNPGAIARIDDTSSEPPVTLWNKRAPATEVNQAAHFLLERPREITTLRVVLDTERVDGWNEIDAIGVVEE